MYLKGLILSALASTAIAQSAGSLAATLASQPDLSNLTSLLKASPQLLNQLSGLSNITVLAPNNDAIMAFTNSSGASAFTSNQQMLNGLLTYHVLNGTYPMINSTQFLHSALKPPMYTNVTGGQVVEATSNNMTVTFFSGLLANSTVVNSTNFTGGVVHIIDRILTLPLNVSSTAIAFNATAVTGALEQARLVETVDTAKDITLFVPDNDALQAIGSALPNLTTQQITSILQYHLIEGQVLYSTMLSNTSVMTAQGGNVTVTIEGGQVYVNSARVIVPDVLVANGVVHVIDGVLNPMNMSAMPQPGTTVPAFSGASSATDVPYTSGVPTPTSSIDVSAVESSRETATGGSGNGASSSSSGGAWMPKATGAMGAAALFGGAAVMMNF